MAVKLALPAFLWIKAVAPSVYRAVSVVKSAGCWTISSFWNKGQPTSPKKWKQKNKKEVDITFI